MPEEKLDVREQEDNNHEEETIPNSEEGIPFFPNHLLKEVIAVFITLAILFTLAIFLPFKLHEKADPLITPEGIKPEWYFLWVYQALKYFPSKILFITGKSVGVLLTMVVVVFLQFVWPILDNAPERHPRRRKAGMIVAAVVLSLGILLTTLSILSERTVTIGGARYHFDLKGIPHKVKTEGLKTVPETGALRISTETDSAGGEENGQQTAPEVDSADPGGKNSQQTSPDTSSAGSEKGGQP